MIDMRFRSYMPTLYKIEFFLIIFRIENNYVQQTIIIRNVLYVV